ncbi:MULTISPECIES: GlxA family transcriptional regulator [unclassified Chelatococcus]|jgi:transcriptional regulator GlxA family with amidase domain|uniref:GlxA family transcriptional regulator n=1 Tax=unclassified Chelatococcus TaxID=2638111 RepID=UPI001BCE1D6F|nr:MULTISPECIES: GlxA family transcriptional regulator [unclassified Chelatococcus]CAH1655458.1 HTH-type transcriptional regulator CdhR [Hyphomicrobiales bacterium]MBS7742607.1 GlxA family transcriptional regulator [Chelatococcus sp. HY11]MBX3542275.1 GlxA family transcriptional regulator [Chelatococcus sp.]MCO5075507.1 GlxA family transcriptional regulator [Chelatococcus sp.]CAH1695493.1 HTH-type transcriptional regulator CdhR [Hyphomicrobiales bacterium]
MRDAPKNPATAYSSAEAPTKVGFLLVPSFALLPYAAAIEPLRAANSLAGRELFSWLHISPDGQPIQASNGVTIVPDHHVGAQIELDLVMVCAGTGVESFRHPQTLAWLRILARQGVPLGGISGGAYVLARAGVLGGYKWTIHWDHMAGIAEEFPLLEMTGKLFEIDRDRMTCSGGITPLDLMHGMIARWHGPRLAAAVSDWFLHTNVRHGDGPQRMDIGQRTGVSHGKLLRVLGVMEKRLEEPASREELAALASVSVRQLERLFKVHLGCTLGRYYLELRVRRARDLMQQTALSVLEVALACGFVSASHFSRAYRAHFGYAPTAERNRKGRGLGQGEPHRQLF